MGEPYYPPLSPAATGMKGKCPRCGEGNLFAGFLTPADGCGVCGLAYDFADAGDGPAWFIMTGIGFVVAAAALIVEVAYQPPYWLHAAMWLPLALALCILPLRPLKGLMIARQYQTGAQEGRLS
ncbi:MAG: DUF983 domain-containing protein [Pseudomonadota bacterium]